MTICSRTSSLMEYTNRSQWALRFSDRGGMTSGSTPRAFSSPSNACVNFVSRSCIRYRFLRRNPSKGSVNCKAHCCIKAAVGCGGDPGHLDPARCQVHHHQYIVGHQAVPRRDFDGKKVGRRERLPMELQELCPAHSRFAALRGGLHMMPTQDITHRQLIDLMSQIG